MDDIFTEMQGGSEAETMQETFQAVMRAYHQNEKMPVSEQFVHQFLNKRVPTWKVDYILKAMFKSGALVSAGMGKIKPGQM